MCIGAEKMNLTCHDRPLSLVSVKIPVGRQSNFRLPQNQPKQTIFV